MKTNALTRAQMNRQIVQWRGWLCKDGTWRQGKTDFQDWREQWQIPNYFTSLELLRDLISTMAKSGACSLQWEPRTKRWTFWLDVDGRRFEGVGKTANAVVARVFYKWRVLEP